MRRMFLMGLMLLAPVFVMASEGCRATICFGTGNTVQTEFFGTKEKILDYVLKGKLNGQRVEYKLSEIKEVIFSEYEIKSYDTGSFNRKAQRGEVVVVAASGKKFVLTECDLNNGKVEYCYLDPVTEGRCHTKLI